MATPFSAAQTARPLLAIRLLKPHILHPLPVLLRLMRYQQGVNRSSPPDDDLIIVREAAVCLNSTATGALVVVPQTVTAHSCSITV